MFATRISSLLEARDIDLLMVEDVAFRLLQAAAPMCGSAAGMRTGLRLGSAHTFSAEWIDAALNRGRSIAR